MRIFDLLNDGDAAAALLAAAQPPTASGATKAKTLDLASTTTHGFPAFLLNAYTLPIKKPTKSTPRTETEIETETDDDVDVASSILTLHKSGGSKTRVAKKTMSIFDLVNPTPSTVPKKSLKRTSTRARIETKATQAKRSRIVDHEDDDDAEAEDAAPPMDSQAQKRQRQRVLFRRNYYKKMQTLSEMRVLRAQLEDEYAQLMWKRNAEQMVQTYLRHNQAPTPRAQVREAYMELCRAKDSLRTENAAMDTVLQDVRKVHDKMRWLVDAEGGLRDDEHIDCTPCPRACQGADPVSRAESEMLARQCRHEIRRQQQLVKPALVDHGATLHNWHVWRRPQGRMTTSSRRVLVTEKRLGHTRVAPLVATWWHALEHANESTTVPMMMLLGHGLVTQCYVVQRVSATHLVLYLALHDDRHALCLVTKSAASQEENAEETMVTVQTLPAPCGSSIAADRWLHDTIAWIQFAKDEMALMTTRVRIGMALPSSTTPNDDEEHWWRLLVIASVQFETHIVGSVARSPFPLNNM